MLTIDDYDRAAQILLDHVSSRSDIISLWRYGAITQPGVSDLDLIAVLKDNPDSGIADYLDRKQFHPLVQSALAHANLIVVPISYSRDLMYWDDIQPHDLATGKLIMPPADFSLNDRRIALLVDWIFERVHTLHQAYHKGLTDQRLSLGLMKSFGYCVSNYMNLTGLSDLSDYLVLKQEVEDLREKWAKLAPKLRSSRLESLFSRYLTFVDTFHEQLFSFFSTHPLYPDVDIGVSYSLAIAKGPHLSFQRAWEPYNGLVTVPTNLLGHYFTYTNTGSELSKKLSTCFEPKPIDGRFLNNQTYRSLLIKRIRAANHWYVFLKRNHFSYGLFKFGWLL